MVSTTKASVSLAVSSSIVWYYCWYYQGIVDLLYLSPFLVGYCLLDLVNSWDMICHHLGTILLNYTFYHVTSNLTRLDQPAQQAVSEIVAGFFLVEVSTVWLSFLHLGYRNWIIKLLFVTSFIYYRIGYLSYLLWSRYQPRYLKLICYQSVPCQTSWYLGGTTVMLLNYYWFGLIVNKLTARVKIHP